MRIRRMWTIRVRLTFWYAAAIAFMLAAYAGGVWLFVKHSFVEELDRRLYDDVENAEEVLVWTQAGDRVAWRASVPDPDRSAESRWLEVWSTNGALLYRSDAAARLPMAPALPAPDGPRHLSATTRIDTMRVRDGGAYVENRPVLMRVARSEDPMLAELAEIGLIMAVGWPVGVAGAAIGGYLLARRALAPVDRMATRASAITAERLSERLPVERPDDELGRLAGAFNLALSRLEQSFEQMRRFTSDASHELRTPLTVVRSVGEVGLQQPRSPEGYREIIGSMLEEVDRLNQMVESLLALSRADAGQAKLSRDRVDLARLVQDTLAQLQVLAEEKGQRLNTTLAHPVTISADPVVLRRAIANILDNAIKYAPRDTDISVALTADGAFAVLAISDQGQGIPAADLEHVFDRFYRVDPARARETAGVGLGLAIAKWIIEAHDGSISVESREGTGSVFQVRLPLFRDGQP